MAIKSSDQITLVDLTDAYSVMLTNDSYTFPGGTGAALAGSCTSQIIAMRGSEQVAASVTISEITGTPTGMTITKNSDATAPTLTFTVTTSMNTRAGAITIPVHVGDVTINKQFSYAIALTGGGGAAAVNVISGTDSAVIFCDKDGAVDGAQTITIPFAGYQGTARKACTINSSTGITGLPSGITVSNKTDATTSADGSIVLAVADNSTLGDASNGVITLSFVCVSQTHVKKLYWSKAMTGATGAQGPQGSQGPQGQAGTSATSVVCGNESVSFPCTLGGLVKAAQTVVIPFAGYIGTARAACTVTYSTLPSGMTLASNGNKAATTSADGSLTFNVAANATLGGATVYNGEITLTFTCNSQTFVKKFSWSKAMTGATGAQGPQGNAGVDAITIAIESSGGIIFKNTDVVTTLTAHVYKGGVEITGDALSALGTLNWYKDGSTTAVGTGATLTINAGDVTNKATYEVKLES